MASSNTFFSPFWVRAEHSTYFTARNSRESFSACSADTGFCFVLANFSTMAASSRRSTCVPTNRKGVLGQWWVISGTHFSFTFSNEAGATTEKQTRNTSVCGYESGRNLQNNAIQIRKSEINLRKPERYVYRKLGPSEYLKLASSYSLCKENPTKRTPPEL